MNSIADAKIVNGKILTQKTLSFLRLPVPVVIETESAGNELVQDIRRRISTVTEDSRESDIAYHLPILEAIRALQRGNAFSFLGAFPHD